MPEYTVSLWSTPMPWPISFAVHLWFVVEYQGVVDRVEVWAPVFRQDKQIVVKNGLPPTAGFRTSYFDSPTSPRHTGATTQLHTFSGDRRSAAGRLYTVLMQAAEEYPYADRYRLWPGPNSNTFIAWVFDQVPEARVKLSWRAVGRHFPH